MPGPAVTIVEEGGIPVIPVEANAPLVTLYEPPTEDDPPQGFAITIVSDHGTPLVIEGYEP